MDPKTGLLAGQAGISPRAKRGMVFRQVLLKLGLIFVVGFVVWQKLVGGKRVLANEKDRLSKEGILKPWRWSEVSGGEGFFNGFPSYDCVDIGNAF